ncbi:MAG: SDR family oxidoreductase [Alphaproteobacteria bacterium]|nr:SDR family oxidoreductase [Alphaproteobacteria bacterium]
MGVARPVTIVTAASQGIGAALANGLVERNHRVVLFARSAGVVDLARKLGGVGMQGSVTEPMDLEAVVQLALTTYGRIDGVVNNTGRDKQSLHVSGSAYDPDLDRSLVDIPDEAWLFGVDLYFLNVVRMARAVTPVLQGQGGGSIVNVSTFVAPEPRLIFPVSGTMRMALAAYTKLFADRYARDGIRMNNILPGFVENWPLSDAVRRTIPMGRAVTMAELAGTVAFLLSGDAGSITGQNLLVDGGVNRGL